MYNTVVINDIYSEFTPHNKLLGIMKKNGKIHASSYDMTPNPCSFYKIMLSPNFDSKLLRLPESFTGIYGTELSSTCHLIVPTGETHQVALVENSRGLWFQDGWKEFMTHFSIGYGYFMTFTYEGNSNFRVKLFDLTACEISYQSDKGTSSSPSASHMDSYVEIMEFDSIDDAMKSVESSKTVSDTWDESECSQLAMDSEDNHQKSSLEGSETSSDTEKEIEDVILELPSWLGRYDEQLKDLRAAGISIPINPFFVGSIKPYNVASTGFYTLPRDFGREHMKCKSGDPIILKMSCGRQWGVLIRIHLFDWRFGKGWNDFARESCLKLNDVCLFELIDAEKYVFKVRLAKPSQVKAT